MKGFKYSCIVCQRSFILPQRRDAKYCSMKHYRQYQQTDAYRDALRQKTFGHSVSNETRKKISESVKTNPTRYWLGKKRDPETVQKLRESTHKMIAEGKLNTPEHREAARKRWLGENNPRWRDGATPANRRGYYTARYKNWRKAVYERDNYMCQDCGSRGVYLTAHHIKSQSFYPELCYDLDNGRTLCEPCHSLTDNYKGRARTLGRIEV